VDPLDVVDPMDEDEDESGAPDTLTTQEKEKVIEN
jgi:hypothetical protein